MWAPEFPWKLAAKASKKSMVGRSNLSFWGAILVYFQRHFKAVSFKKWFQKDLCGLLFCLRWFEKIKLGG